MGSRESLQRLQSLGFERILWVQDSAHWAGCGIGDGVVSNFTCTLLVKLNVFHPEVFDTYIISNNIA